MKPANYINLILLIFLCSAGCKNEELNSSQNIPQKGEFKNIFEFNFNENSGNKSVENNTGTELDIIHSGNEANRMDGVDQNTLFFDGFSTYVEGSLPQLNTPQGQISISLWAGIKSFPINTAGLFSMTHGSDKTGVFLSIDKFGKLIARYFFKGNLQIRAISSKALPRYQWCHLLAAVDTQNGVIKLYFNGELVADSKVGSETLPWSKSDSETNIYIGNAPKDDLDYAEMDYFSGTLDEIKVHEGTPNLEEVIELSQAFEIPGQINFNTDLSYLENDPNRPIFHPIPDYGWTNEPNGLIYYKGEYHMFYQKNEVFLGIAQQNWGHMKSKDLVQWDDLNSVLWPEPNPYDNFGTWAGCSAINDDGHPVIMYTGVDGVKATMALATSYDNMQTFQKFEGNPVIERAPDDVNLDFRDPFIWKEGETWYMIVGSGIAGVGGNLVLYASNDLYNWEDSYKGIFFQGDVDMGEGEFWEVPIIHQFPNGKYLLLVQKTPDATSPARTFYWTGDFDGEKFIPEERESKDFEVVNGFLSPTVTNDANGNTTAIGIIPDEVHPDLQKEAGWAHLFSIPQVWTLSQDNSIQIKPHPNVLAYRKEEKSFNQLIISPLNENHLNGLRGRHIEIEASLNTGNASKVGFIIGKSDDGQEKLRLYLDVTNQEWVIDASKSSLDSRARRDIRKGKYPIQPNQIIDLRIFIDGSVIEVFVNGEDHFTGRFFPTLSSSSGIDVFAEGGEATIQSLSAWRMGSKN